MAREIKFRAWNKHSKKMLLVLEIWFKKNQVHTDGLRGALLDIDGISVFCEFSVIEVMQYTGLKDKNNKEIYEGDILNYDDSRPLLTVFFQNGSFMYSFGEKAEAEFMHEGWGYYSKVIGNIYENPELIKK